MFIERSRYTLKRIFGSNKLKILKNRVFEPFTLTENEMPLFFGDVDAMGPKIGN